VKLPDHAKVWSNFAYAAATVCFIKANWGGVAPFEIWAVYLMVVGLHTSADKLIQLKYGPQRDPQ
jgi:hypothetical protein